jgi:nucleoside-diphosphate-sugar epimerase
MKAIEWGRFCGKTVLITGATGLLGGALARTLGELNRARQAGATILAVGRDAARGAELSGICGVRFVRHDIREPFADAGRLAPGGRIDYIIHCAAVTRSAQMASDPCGVIDTEVLGARNVLALARASGISGMVYTSSMEEYGITDAEDLTEDLQGYIDVGAARSCYPQGKRMAETMCSCWARQHGLPIRTARLGMTIGPGYAGDDQRVWAQFANAAKAGESITLLTEGTSVRSIVYLYDAAQALLLLLLAGENAAAYNVSAASLSIRELAEQVAAAHGLRVEVRPPQDLKAMGFNPDFKLRLNSGKIRALGWAPRYSSATDMFARLQDGS